MEDHDANCKRWIVGDKVKVKFPKQEYPATIVEPRTSGMYTVRYDDGRLEEKEPSSIMNVIEVGTRLRRKVKRLTEEVTEVKSRPKRSGSPERRRKQKQQEQQDQGSPRVEGNRGSSSWPSSPSRIQNNKRARLATVQEESTPRSHSPNSLQGGEKDGTYHNEKENTVRKRKAAKGPTISNAPGNASDHRILQVVLPPGQLEELGKGVPVSHPEKSRTSDEATASPFQKTSKAKKGLSKGSKVAAPPGKTLRAQAKTKIGSASSLSAASSLKRASASKDTKNATARISQRYGNLRSQRDVPKFPDDKYSSTSSSSSDSSSTSSNSTASKSGFSTEKIASTSLSHSKMAEKLVIGTPDAIALDSFAPGGQGYLKELPSQVALPVNAIAPCGISPNIASGYRTYVNLPGDCPLLIPRASFFTTPNMLTSPPSLHLYVQHEQSESSATQLVQPIAVVLNTECAAVVVRNWIASVVQVKSVYSTEKLDEWAMEYGKGTRNHPQWVSSDLLEVIESRWNALLKFRLAEFRELFDQEKLRLSHRESIQLILGQFEEGGCFEGMDPGKWDEYLRALIAPASPQLTAAAEAASNAYEWMTSLTKWSGAFEILNVNLEKNHPTLGMTLDQHIGNSELEATPEMIYFVDVIESQLPATSIVKKRDVLYMIDGKPPPKSMKQVEDIIMTAQRPLIVQFARFNKLRSIE